MPLGLNVKVTRERITKNLWKASNNHLRNVITLPVSFNMIKENKRNSSYSEASL